MHAVMKHWHPMIGMDFHIPWPPGAPVPAPAPAPYKTFSTLMGLGITASYATTHMSSGMGSTILQGSDIGPMIPHIGVPSTTMAIEMPLSSSKSYFGVASHQVEGKPIAAALAVTVNPNLNCGTPVPAPFGFVLALNTHMVGMTWADVFGGAAGMAADWVIQSALQWAGGKIGGRIAARLAPKAMGRVAARQAARLANNVRAPGTPKLPIGDAARALRSAANGRAEQYGRLLGHGVDPLIGTFVGGPMGIDAGNVDVFTPGGWVADTTQKAVSNYFNDPAVEQHPSGASSVGSPDAGGGSPDAGGGSPDAGVGSPDAGAGGSDAGPSDAGLPAGTGSGSPDSNANSSGGSSQGESGGMCLGD